MEGLGEYNDSEAPKQQVEAINWQVEEVASTR